ncbi:MAG TPA: tRNA preQ1(34) S-adenosylmethionine ribosyltransferase-isomerase QueA [Gemmatimonadales bacterium]|nr:tRNA preQ1(34) S-adenosylmethionine ribosyltransferase-isomerase QueA [Gemmatimonadales bacterium]
MSSTAGTPRHFAAADFDYRYPPELIAQHPAPERGGDRLLVLERSTGTITHRMFRDLPELVRDGDVLVVNRSRVIPARLHAIRDNGRPAELLLVHAEPDGTWLAMVHPGGKLKAGRRVRFGDDARAEIVDVVGGGLRRVRFSGALDVHGVMERYGSVPLPPYITHAPDAEDAERYQTIYARDEGSVAAPTAGLHFTEEIFERVRARGAEIAELVLHVGPGTFKPVEVDDPEAHTMHAEWYAVPDEAAAAVNRAKARGGRVWAVGTTSARVLETVGQDDGTVRAGSGWTDLFIHPPFTFRVVDALLTNFHLPRSTLLMLVAAFAGYEHTMAAYRTAVAERYRLYSYGDAMAIV